MSGDKDITIPKSVLNQLSVEAFQVSIDEKIAALDELLDKNSKATEQAMLRAVKASKRGRAALEFVKGKAELRYYNTRWGGNPHVEVRCKNDRSRFNVPVSKVRQRKLDELESIEEQLERKRDRLRQLPTNKPTIIAEIVRRDEGAIRQINEIVSRVIRQRYETSS